MGVADDVAVASNVLRSSVVGARGVGEGAEVHVGDAQLDVERLKLGDNVVVLGVLDDGRHHVADGRDFTHDCRALACLRR